MSAANAQAAPAAAAAPASGNMSLGQLSAMFQKKSGEASAAATTTEGAPAAASEPAGKGKAEGKAKAAATAAALGETTETTETTEAASAAATTEPAATEAAGEAAAPSTEATEGTEGTEAAEGTEEARELPPEVKAAIEELKASGDKTGGKLLKRIHRLADQRDTERNARLQAEEALRQTQAQVQQLRENPDPGRPGPEAGGRYAAHPDIAALDRQLAQAEGVIEWAEANPDGAEVEGKPFTAAQLAQFKRTAEKNVARLTASREAKVAAFEQAEGQDRAKFNTQARTLYPWLTKPQSPEYVEASAFHGRLPQSVRQMPGIELVVGRYMAGLRAEQARAAKPAAAAAPVKPAVKPAPMAAAPGAAPAASRAEPKGKKSQITVRDLASQFAESANARRQQREAA